MAVSSPVSFADRESFDAWSAGPFDPDRAETAVHRLGVEARPMGFATFRNGGRPKLERRRDGAIQELIVRASPAGVWIDLHASHEGVTEYRTRYGRGRRAPSILAGGQLGEFALPPRFLGWTEPDAEFADRAIAIAAPWFDLLLDGDALAEAWPKGVAPALGSDVTGELLLLFCGVPEARKFVRARRQAEPELDGLILHGPSRLPVRWEEARPVERLAAFARTYRLG